MGFKRKKMQALTLHIELFALQRLLFRFCNLLCRTARCAQPSVPEVNLIRTNIFMYKVLRVNNFSLNHNTSKNLTANIQQLFQNASVKGAAYIPSAKDRWVLCSNFINLRTRIFFFKTNVQNILRLPKQWQNDLYIAKVLNCKYMIIYLINILLIQFINRIEL